MKVVCISGKAGHGKDTVATFMNEKLLNEGHRVLITHYGDLVKYICFTYFNWDGEKDIPGRSLLQKVGTDTIRAQSPDYLVDFIASMLTFFNDQWDYILIPDTRFPNEIEVLKAHGFDVSTVRVNRSNHESKLTEEQLKHPSETSLDNWDFDFYINNNHALENLEWMTYAVVNDIIKR